MKPTGGEELQKIVSELVPESLVFFLRNKFDIIDKVVGKYKPGIVEYILQYQGGKNL